MSRRLSAIDYTEAARQILWLTRAIGFEIRLCDARKAFELSAIGPHEERMQCFVVLHRGRLTPKAFHASASALADAIARELD